jgi:hypothetical protein
MDINDLRNQARLSYDRAVAKKNIQERMENRMTVSHNGGVFKVEPDLFVMLDLPEDNGWNDEMILLDAYDTPVKVNREELHKLAKQRYFEIMNEWYAEWQDLKKVRKAEDV